MYMYVQMCNVSLRVHCVCTTQVVYCVCTHRHTHIPRSRQYSFVSCELMQSKESNVHLRRNLKFREVHQQTARTLQLLL